MNHYLTILKNECQREITLINDLLDLSRLDAGNASLNLSQVDLKVWIAHLASPFIERAHNQQQQLSVDVSNTIPLLTTDIAYLERLLTELLTNACKYTPAGEKITITAAPLGNATGDRNHGGDRNDDATTIQRLSQPLERVKWRNVQYQPFISICVTNTGVEIPEHECDRIFEKFYRIPSNDPWKYGGTGLGLALVKKLAERLGGAIHLESAAKQTAFTLRLPIMISPE